MESRILVEGLEFSQGIDKQACSFLEELASLSPRTTGTPDEERHSTKAATKAAQPTTTENEYTVKQRTDHAEVDDQLFYSGTNAVLGHPTFGSFQLASPSTPNTEDERNGSLPARLQTEYSQECMTSSTL